MRQTESNNAATRNFSRMTTEEMLSAVNDADQTVADAVRAALPALGRAVDAILPRMQSGGRLFYVGCGTSGRLGVLDASEVGCTYGADNLVYAISAGGIRGLTDASVGDEDDAANGARSLARYKITAKDTVVGLSASGRTPYVLGALQKGRAVGALNVGVVNNSDSKISEIADVAVEILTGPEVIEGSTRMKAGTSQKMVLNMLSTVLMTKLGKVYGNYMIGMRASNEKLRRRAVTIVCACADCTPTDAFAALEAADWNIALAISAVSNGDDCAETEANRARENGDAL